MVATVCARRSGSGSLFGMWDVVDANAVGRPPRIGSKNPKLHRSTFRSRIYRFYDPVTIIDGNKNVRELDKNNNQIYYSDQPLHVTVRDVPVRELNPRIGIRPAGFVGGSPRVYLAFQDSYPDRSYQVQRSVKRNLGSRVACRSRCKRKNRSRSQCSPPVLVHLLVHPNLSPQEQTCRTYSSCPETAEPWSPSLFLHRRGYAADPLHHSNSGAPSFSILSSPHSRMLCSRNA